MVALIIDIILRSTRCVVLDDKCVLSQVLHKTRRVCEFLYCMVYLVYDRVLNIGEKNHITLVNRTANRTEREWNRGNTLPAVQQMDYHIWIKSFLDARVPDMQDCVIKHLQRLQFPVSMEEHDKL